VRADRVGPGPARYPVYVPKMSRHWWLGNPGYRRFAARELTAVFAAAYSVILLLFLVALSRGPGAYEGFLRWLNHPGTVALHVVLLVAILYHAGTWFRLTSRAVVVRLGRRTVPGRAVEVGLFGGWVVASGIIAYFLVWF
jgi:fumarate reductase subunit C